MNWLSIFGTLGDLITEPVKSWQARKRAKLDSDLKVNEAVTEAKIQRLSVGQSADIAWENLSIQNSSWKDEFWTIVIAIPAVMAFVPNLAVHVAQGFAALQNTPDWYQWALSIAIGSAFGVRQFTNYKKISKGDA